MKKINIKNNKVIIIYNIFLLILFLIIFLGYIYYDSGKDFIVKTSDTKILEYNKKRHIECKMCHASDLSDEEIELCDSNGAYFEPCNSYWSKLEILPLENYASSAQELFSSALLDSSIGSYIVPFFIPLLIIFPTVYILSKEYKSKIIKNELLRKNYKDYVKKILKLGYKNIWVIPTIFIIIFIVSYLLTGNLDPRFMEGQVLSRHYGLFQNPLFYIIYIFIIYLNYGFYVNLAILITTRNKKFTTSLLETYLLIYFIWIFNEIFVSKLLDSLNIDVLYGSMLNIYSWPNISNMYLYLIIQAIPWFITFILVIFKFINKEKIFMQIER